MADWEIKKPLGKCVCDDQEFEVGQEYFSALLETEEGFERRDYCVECWERDRPDAYCFWKTRMADEKDKNKKIFIDDEMLMAFFERLGEETEQEKLNFRFVLTLILMQKRKLKYQSDAVVDGQEVWYMKVAGQGRTVKVVNPHLSEDQIEELSGQMGQILQVDL
ncbi:hypothetical protein STSP2_01839 [Anaerohalosphaera lusitana]|uniref:Uncharacterized protein n=1 Tax=Anaerohalosphaera lusitana TaxID=1936003 RepID=A0A1U9NM52_9BACT|nr:hypothetical protein [Anaerohalosphaera lusitana]AQT68670.1 hypothetical protein STSP2_01839 [Anaerohalosphaera lusitana]